MVLFINLSPSSPGCALFPARVLMDTSPKPSTTWEDKYTEKVEQKDQGSGVVRSGSGTQKYSKLPTTLQVTRAQVLIFRQFLRRIYPRSTLFCVYELFRNTDYLQGAHGRLPKAMSYVLTWVMVT